MKIRVFSPTDIPGVRGNPFEIDDPHDFQRIRVIHAGEEYELAVVRDGSVGGRLELRHIGGGQLIIKPNACNLVEISSMSWPPPWPSLDANKSPAAKKKRKR